MADYLGISPLADTLLDYGSDSGWRLYASPVAGDIELPVVNPARLIALEYPDELFKRGTPKAYMVPTESPVDCRFQVGRDFFHPDYSYALIAEYELPRNANVFILIELRLILENARSSIAVCVWKEKILQGRSFAFYGSTLCMRNSLMLNSGEKLLVSMSPVGSIDYMYAYYRIRLFEDLSNITEWPPSSCLFNDVEWASQILIKEDKVK